MRADPYAMPVIRVAFSCADGTVIEREWTLNDLLPMPVELKATPPAWLLDPREDWPTPQSPVTYTGRVAPGHEAAARAWVWQLGQEALR